MMLTVVLAVLAVEIALLPPLELPPPDDVPAPPVVIVVEPPVWGCSGMIRNCGVDEPFSKVRNESASALVGGNGHRARGLENCASSLLGIAGGVSMGVYPSGRPFVKTSLNFGIVNTL
jgi:hypothetical protein